MTRYQLQFTDVDTRNTTTVTVRAEQGDTPARLAAWAIQVACASLGVTNPSRLRMSGTGRVWQATPDPRVRANHIAVSFVEPLRDLGRFNCRGDYILPVDTRIDATDL